MQSRQQMQFRLSSVLDIKQQDIYVQTTTEEQSQPLCWFFRKESEMKPFYQSVGAAVVRRAQQKKNGIQRKDLMATPAVIPATKPRTILSARSS